MPDPFSLQYGNDRGRQLDANDIFWTLIAVNGPLIDH